MHMFMWFMLLYLARIKHSYKMGPRMLTQFAPFPIEMGEYGIDEGTFWRRVAVARRDSSSQDIDCEVYPQIKVDATNQTDKLECTPCFSCKDWTLTVLSYRVFYTLLVLGIWVIILDGF